MATVLEHLKRIAGALKRGNDPDLGSPAILESTANQELSESASSPWRTTLVKDDDDLIAFAREHLDDEQINWNPHDGGVQADSDSAQRLMQLVSSDSEVHLLKKSADAETKRVFIGRAKRNDVVVRDDTVSSIHVQIEPTDDEHAVVVDCRSSNGTFLNGERLEPNKQFTMKSGDCLRLGQRVYYFMGRNSLRIFLKMRLADALARSQMLGKR